MKREEVESMVKEFGFEGQAVEKAEENKVVYSFPRSGGYGSIIINGADLFVNDWTYLKIEIDNYGIVARLYYDIHYIGCRVYSWEDVECFRMKKGF